MLDKGDLNSQKLYLNEKLHDVIVIFIEGPGESRHRLREAWNKGKLLAIASVVSSSKEFTGIHADYLNRYLKHLRKDLLKYGEVHETINKVRNKTASRIMGNLYNFLYMLHDSVGLELEEK